ncbi:sialidase family protein [Paenibacillus eucommiae]|uniref:Neuraminidase (Sialidase) n=1 Tax=Paenibacillus eucommiae TaxID=1355755 RepID=A0ABS4IS72_9BACL|nr:sialidase family protein [Paenibacillus eucommiae]MBP1990411.1 Neuraminidase (sialidase) [Paenibacillus eucommiae]
MNIIDRGTIYPGNKQCNRNSCIFPSVCILADGRWVAGFRAAPSKSELPGQEVVITWSDDEGKNWSELITPFIQQMVDGRQGSFRTVHLLALGGQRLLAALSWIDQTKPELAFFNTVTEGLLDARIFLSFSEDGGESWSLPSLMDTPAFPVPTPTTGPVLRLGNGELACQFELNKHYDDPAVWRHSAVLMFSKDEGVTWKEHSIAAHDPANRFYYWDQRPSVFSSGELLNVFWTYDNELAQYANIHMRKSVDHGRTWSEYRDTGVPGQPAPVVPFGDNAIAMVYVDRTGTPAIRMKTSKDGGLSWSEATLDVSKPEGASQTREKGSMQDAWAEMSLYSKGLPGTAVLANGDILIVYYDGPGTDYTGIEWVRVQKPKH